MDAFKVNRADLSGAEKFVRIVEAFGLPKLHGFRLELQPGCIHMGEPEDAFLLTDDAWTVLEIVRAEKSWQATRGGDLFDVLARLEKEIESCNPQQKPEPFMEETWE